MHESPTPRADLPTPTEDQLHAQVAEALTLLLAPPVEWTTFPAGGYRLPVSAAARLYRLGLQSSWPDILIVHAGRLLGIELKTTKGRLNRTRLVKGKRRTRVVVGQAVMHGRLRAAGALIAVCRSLDDVLAALRGWGVPMRGVQ